MTRGGTTLARRRRLPQRTWRVDPVKVARFALALAFVGVSWAVAVSAILRWH